MKGKLLILMAETIFHVIVIFVALVVKKGVMGEKGERYEVADNNTDRK